MYILNQPRYQTLSSSQLRVCDDKNDISVFPVIVLIMIISPCFAVCVCA